MERRSFLKKSLVALFGVVGMSFSVDAKQKTLQNLIDDLPEGGSITGGYYEIDKPLILINKNLYNSTIVMKNKKHFNNGCFIDFSKSKNSRIIYNIFSTERQS